MGKAPLFISLFILSCRFAAAENPKSLYADEASLRADVEKAFLLAKGFSGFQDARLVYSSGDNPTCTSGATGDAVPFVPVYTVTACSQLRFWAANFDQVLFVMAHEFAHFKFAHEMAVARNDHRVLTAWMAAHPGATFEQAKQATQNDRNRFFLDTELEADRQATDWMIQAGHHPAHGAFLLHRAKEDFLRREGPNPFIDQIARERTQGIMSTVPDFVKRLPSRSPDSVFQP